MSFKIVNTGGPMPEPDPSSDIRDEHDEAVREAEAAELTQKVQEDAFLQVLYDQAENDTA